MKNFKLTNMATILDIGTDNISNSDMSPRCLLPRFSKIRLTLREKMLLEEFKCRSHGSHQVSAQTDLQFGRSCGLKNFKMRYGGHL